MATLLIIGGTGFFGKSIIDSFHRGQLDKWGVDHIIAMSRNADRLIVEAPELLDSRIELLNSDIGTTDKLPSADFVIHAASSTDARNYLTRPEIEKQNIQSAILNYCRLAPKFHKNSKILYVSSGAVYGTQPKSIEYLDEDYESNNPEDIPDGKRDYSIAKREAELIFRELGKKEEMNISIARCFAFVGKWLPRNQHFAIGNFIEDGLQKRPIKVKATFPVFRSYMYADDLVNWLMTIVNNASNNCEIYNVGSDYSVSMIELAKILSKEFDVGVDVPHQICDDKNDLYIPSIEKAKKILELKVNYDLKHSIRETINSIQN